MEFQAKLNEQETQTVLNLLDQAIRSGGSGSARVALPIMDSLLRQADEYNKSLAPKKTDCHKDPVAQ